MKTFSLGTFYRVLLSKSLPFPGLGGGGIYFDWCIQMRQLFDSYFHKSSSLECFKKRLRSSKDLINSISYNKESSMIRNRNEEFLY